MNNQYMIDNLNRQKDRIDEMMKEKYMKVSNTLFEMFMVEHNSIGEMFKGN